MSIYYEKSDVGYQLEVGAYWPYSCSVRSEEHTSPNLVWRRTPMPCDALEWSRSYTVPLSYSKDKQRVIMPLFRLSCAVDDSGSLVATSDSNYTVMPLAHARSSTMFFAYIVSFKSPMAVVPTYDWCIGTLSGHNGTGWTMDENKRWNPLTRATTLEGGLHVLSARTIFIAFARVDGQMWLWCRFASCDYA